VPLIGMHHEVNDTHLLNQQFVLGTLHLLYVISLVGPADCEELRSGSWAGQTFLKFKASGVEGVHQFLLAKKIRSEYTTEKNEEFDASSANTTMMKLFL
jgi:hypothetical protein